MLTKVNHDDLICMSFYIVIRKIIFNETIERVDTYVAQFNGSVGRENHKMMRCLNVHKRTKKYAMELFPQEDTQVYSIPTEIPYDVFMTNILPFL